MRSTAVVTPTSVGRPLRYPVAGSSVSPRGSEPAPRIQRYGRTPPAAASAVPYEWLAPARVVDAVVMATCGWTAIRAATTMDEPPLSETRALKPLAPGTAGTPRSVQSGLSTSPDASA